MFLIWQTNSLLQMSLIVLLCGGTQPSGSVVAEHPSLEEIERRIVESRLAIRSAAVEIDSKLNGEDGERTTRQKIYIEPEKDRWRVDFTRPGQSGSVQPVETHYTEFSCMNCTPEGHYVFWSTYRVVASAPIGVSIHYRDGIPESERSPSAHIQSLGLALQTTANSHYHAINSDGSPLRRDPTSVQMSEIEFRGVPHLLASFHRPNGVVIRCVIAPHQAYNIVRMEVGEPTIAWVESELMQREEVPGLWYPVSCIYEKRVDGELHEREDAEIRLTLLNQPLDDDVFSLRGIKELPSGTPVLYSLPDRPPRGLHEWNGSSIVLAPDPPPVASLPVPAGARQRDWTLLWVNLAVVSAIVGIYLFRRWRGSPSH